VVKKIRIILLFAAISVAAAFSLFAGDNAAGKTYYTKVNIWYETAQISSVNYHRGSFIPVGTKVVISNLHLGGITFKFGRDEAEFTISKSLHTPISRDDLFGHYFSPGNPLESESYLKFSQSEKENIKKGKISAGMSKDAAIMAYGYPSGQAKEDTDADTWTYAKSHFRKLSVTFSHGKVSMTSEEEKQKLNKEDGDD